MIDHNKRKYNRRLVPGLKLKKGRTPREPIGRYWVIDWSLPTQLVVYESKNFKRDRKIMEKFRSTPAKWMIDKINRFIEDLYRGYIFKDAVKSDKSHEICEYSEPFKKDPRVAWSKKIDSNTHRFNYYVYKPYINDDGIQIVEISLRGCYGHHFGDKRHNKMGEIVDMNYSDTTSDLLGPLKDWN